MSEYSVELKKIGSNVDAILKDYKGMGEKFDTVKKLTDEQAEQIKKLTDAMDAIQVAQTKMQVTTDAGMSPEYKAMIDNIMNVKSASVSNAASGGYVAVPEFVARIEKKLRDIDPMWEYAEVLNVKANVVQWPYEKDDAAAHWVGELETNNTHDGGTIGVANIPVNKIVAKIKITDELLEDGAINMESYLVNAVSDKINRATGAAFCVGDGFNKPLGVFEDSAVTTVKAGSTSTVTPDNLVKLWQELPSAADANSRYYASKAVIAHVRRSKGSDGHYLLPSVGYGIPMTFDGFPIIALPSAPSISANNKTVIFGDMQSAYKIVVSKQMTYKRDDNSGADDGLVFLRFTSRVGGQTVMPSSIRALKMES